MNIQIINGPNLNLLGKREPGIYGQSAFEPFLEALRKQYPDVTIEYYQSNVEGFLIDHIQKVGFTTDGIILNAGAYTHTSVALLDALKAVGIPTVEVHISDVDTREEFRRVSYVRAACVACIKGHGFAGYCEAIDLLLSLGQPAQGEEPPCV